MALQWHKTSTTKDPSAMDLTTPFDRRLENIPSHWRGPLVEVLDTAEAVRLKLQEWNMQDDPTLLLELTRLVLARHDHGEQP